MSYRRRDPSTSVAASNAAAQFVPCHQSAILAALGLFWPAGKTILGQRCGMSDVAVCRRLSELQRAGQVAVDGIEYSAAGRPERRFRLLVGKQ